jgi:rubrerythrin
MIINSVEECFEAINVTDKHPELKFSNEFIVYDFKCKICGWTHNPWTTKRINMGLQTLNEYLYQHIFLAHIYKVEIPEKERYYKCNHCNITFTATIGIPRICPNCESININEIKKE